MSTPNPTHIIAEVVRAGVGGLAGRYYYDELAAHVVSKLTDAGYSIVENSLLLATANQLGREHRPNPAAADAEGEKP